MASRTSYSTWTPQKTTLFDGHYLRNRSTLDIGVLGYIAIVSHKEHSPEVLSIPPGTPCIYMMFVCLYVEIKCQLDAAEVFIADPIVCSTCFGHHYAHHRELKSIIQWLLPVVFRAVKM